MKTLAISLILLGCAVGASAAAEPDAPDLVTDRPDQTESPLVVPAGTVQVEIGSLFTNDEKEGTHSETSAAPSTLVRYSFHPRFELRLEWPGWVEAETRDASGRSRVSEPGDPELGVKVALAAARGKRPDVALIAHLSLPWGSEPIGSPRADPTARLTVAHTLSERVGFGWNVGWEAQSFRDTGGQIHTLTRFIYTASCGFDISERLGSFVEVFGDLPASDPGRSAHSLDGGVTYLVTPRVQIDFSAGVALESEAPDRFVGFGISFRLPR